MPSNATPRRFQFLREIASGGFGSVYLAKVIHADGFSRLVAVKLLHKRWSENDEVASRMRDEARLLGWLRHRNIVEVLDLTFIDGRSAVVMEYLEAIDAKGLIERCSATRVPVPVPVVCEFGASCASALDAAYNRPPYAGEKPLRVIHRDIKPSNLMLDSHGTVKVLDFGVARAEFDSREAKTAELSFGSLEYMPPERLFFEPESPASDVYSLGSTLFELMALEKLGKARLRQSEQDRFVQERLDGLFSRRRVDASVLDELRNVLTRMLAFDESDRPTSAELVTQLRALSRRCPEPQVEDWAVQNVLTFMDALRTEPGGDGGTLLGQTLSEDTAGGAEGTRGVGGEPEEITGTATEVFQVDVDGPESAEYTTSTGHDEARWSALKEATLASLNETGELSKAQLPPTLGGRLGEATVPSRGATPKPVSPRANPTLAPLDLSRSGSDDATIPDVSPDDETLADGAPTVADLARTSRRPPPSVTQRIAVNRDKKRSAPPSSSRTPSAPPPAPRRQAPVVPRSAPPPPPEEEGSLFSIELIMATGAVAAAGLGTFLFVLAIGIPVVALLLGVWPAQPTLPAPPAPVVIEPAPPEPIAVERPAPTPDPEPVAPDPPTPTPTPAPPTPSAASTDGLVFVSEMADTKKMNVRCDAASGQGEGSVALGDVTPKECTVIALDAARKRRTAVVKDPKQKTYRCFSSAADTCEPAGK